MNFILVKKEDLRHRPTFPNQKMRIINSRKTPFSVHIDTSSNEDQRYCIFLFYKIQTTDNAIRKIKEAHFIKVFKP